MHRGVPLAIVSLLLSSAAVTVPAQPAETTPAKVLDRYAAGQRAEAVASVAAQRRLDDWSVRYKLEAATWILQGDHPGLRRRQAAAFVLELTRARLESDWRLLRDLIEWTCADFRLAGPPDDFERVWHMAALALAGRARDRIWLLGEVPLLPDAKPRRQTEGSTAPRHLTHAAERLDNSPAVRLEWIVAYSWLSDRETRGGMNVHFEMVGRFGRRGDVIRSLQPLTADPDVGLEATLRLAQLLFAAGDHNGALTAVTAPALANASPNIAYVAHIIAGRSLAALGRPGQAADAYVKALNAVPDGEAASLALTAMTMTSDAGPAQLERMRVSLPTGSANADPWRLFLYGGFRYWPERIQAVREELTR